MTFRVSGALLLGAFSACGGTGSEIVDDLGLPANLVVRTGDVVAIDPELSGRLASNFEVEPDLPAGLTLDPDSGRISGVPVARAATAAYRLRAEVGPVTVEDTIEIAVGNALPSEVAELDSRFDAERLVVLPQPPGKMAVAPDGRIFLTELMTGSIRILSPGTGLQAMPFATLTVQSGGHQGLLGLALSPDFETDSLVFATAVVPAAGGQPVRTQLWRWREDSGLGVDATLLLDDLPAAAINNAGTLLFDSTGMLLLSIGDVEQPSLAQDPNSFAGKILRLDPNDGSAPSDNPDPTSLVFASGFRNTFAMAQHPEAGSIYAADNGPVSDDELNLLQGGKNYEWGSNGEGFGADTGPELRHWNDVVVPTGLAVRDDRGVPAWPFSGAGSLFLALYDEEILERFEVSGSARTDIDSESVFLRFLVQGVANQPVDLQFGTEGELLVLTTTAVFRIDAIR
ncbi:MAG: PQQ-dependent sugar dehydrogenase [Planctomycetota bacterium]